MQFPRVRTVVVLFQNQGLRSDMAVVALDELVIEPERRWSLLKREYPYLVERLVAVLAEAVVVH